MKKCILKPFFDLCQQSRITISFEPIMNTLIYQAMYYEQTDGQTMHCSGSKIIQTVMSLTLWVQCELQYPAVRYSGW